MIGLVLIDIQKGLDEAEFWGGTRNNPEAEFNCRRLLDFFRERGLPLYHVQHCSKNPESPLYRGKPGWEIKPEVAPLQGEVVIQKSTNSAFVNTDLEERLRNANITGLIIAGLTTDHCVSASVRTAADLEFEVILPADATATYAKSGIGGQVFEASLIHATALASLRGEFAQITTTHQLLSQLDKQEFL